MNKRELKVRLKEAIKIIEEFKSNIDNNFSLIDDISDSFDNLKNIEEEHGIDLQIDFDEAISNAIISLLEEDEDYQGIEGEFDNIISDLECWMEDVSERKQEQIQEEYINVIEEFKSNIDLSEVFDKDSLDDMLIGVINSIEESGLV